MLKIIVRLTRSCYMRGDTYVYSTSIRTLKRLSTGCINDVLDDIEELPFIHNIDSYKPGVYELTTCNEEYDRESSVVDNYELKLIKLED